MIVVSSASLQIGVELINPPATFAQRVAFCLLLGRQRIFFGFSFALQLANIASLALLRVAGNEVLPVPAVFFAIATPLSLVAFAIGVASPLPSKHCSALVGKRVSGSRL